MRSDSVATSRPGGAASLKGGRGTMLALAGLALAAAAAPSPVAANQEAVRGADSAHRGAGAERQAKRREAELSRCDRRRGTTLAASKIVRFYGIWETASRNDPARGLFACTYKDGRRYRLTRSARSGGPSQFGVNGNALFFVESSRSDLASRDAGIVYVTTKVWDARKREIVGDVPSTSAVYSDLAISPAGVVAAIADPRGRQPDGIDGQPLPPQSQVVVYDPTGYRPPAGADRPAYYPPWRALASGAPGAFSQLATSSDTLYWQSAGATNNAPFRAPTR